MKIHKFLVLFFLTALSTYGQHVQVQNKPTSKLDPPLSTEEISVAMGRVRHEGYVHRVLDSFDQFMGAIIGLQNDQTISSATEIAAHKNGVLKPFAVALNDGLDLIQRSHGQLAQAGDLERCTELKDTDAAALTAETGILVIPTVDGAELHTAGKVYRIKVNPDNTVSVTEP